MPRQTLLEYVKGNPVVTTLAAVAFLGVTITGAISSFDMMDQMVVTHEELNVDMAAHRELIAGNEAAIKEIKDWNRCARLERRLEELANRKWRLEHPPEGETIDQDAVRDAERDIAAIQRQYNALECARVLTG